MTEIIRYTIISGRGEKTMSFITTLPDRLCEWFSDMNEFTDYSFCTQYPSGLKSSPLDKPIIVFGTKSIEVFDNSVDGNGSLIINSRNTEEKFTVGIHIPRSMGGSELGGILDRIIDLLLFNTPLYIKSIKSEEPTYIRNIDSIYLESVFVTTETIKRGTDYPTSLKLDE